MCTYIYIYMCIYTHNANNNDSNNNNNNNNNTRHIIPPSEIDLGLSWPDFTDLEGKHLFHRIG